jgi:phage terminase Nu1 subunit (DNA packaging protein)
MTKRRPNQATLARELNLSPARITQLKRKGMPTYSAEAAKEWHKQNIAPKATIKASSSGLPPKGGGERVGSNYDQSRARREAAEANIAEMKHAEMQGSLIRVDAVRHALASKISATRDAMLQIPARVAPMVAAECDIATCTLIIERAVHSALIVLAGGDVEGAH